MPNDTYSKSSREVKITEWVYLSLFIYSSVMLQQCPLVLASVLGALYSDFFLYFVLERPSELEISSEL